MILQLQKKILTHIETIKHVSCNRINILVLHTHESIILFKQILLQI